MHRVFESAYAGALRVLTAGRGLAWQADEGTTFRIDPRCRWIRDPGYEADVVSYLRGAVRPGDCCVDVGAHVGFYVLRMAKWSAPGGRVVAFEPNPAARAVLRSNVALNDLRSRVTIEALAAGAAAGTASLFHSGETSGLSRLEAPNPDSASGRPIVVDVIALDAYCADAGLRPDWILIDAEGAELSVLEGAAGLLRESPVQVIVEMHGSLWSDRTQTASRFESLLRLCGRRVVPLTGQRDLFADYGTIVLARS